MQLASMPLMNFDRKQFFLLLQLWKEHDHLYKCILCQLAGYMMVWDNSLGSLECGKTNVIQQCLKVMRSYFGSDHIYKAFGQ